MYQILAIDDEENILSALRRTLLRCPELEGRCQFEAFTIPDLALLRMREHRFDLVISDYRMPLMDGLAFLRAVRETQPEVACIMLSGQADMTGLVGAINDVRIYRFIYKPWQEYELCGAVSSALAYQQLLAENQRLADEVRVRDGVISRQQLELLRLERENPGITQVTRDADGAVVFGPLGED